MISKNYELIEHTADIGLRVRGRDPRGLFINAAKAVFEIIAEKKKTQGRGLKEITIELSADSIDELFINWLNELLSLSATKELIFSVFHISTFKENKLKAFVSGAAFKNYKINTEIKAATYHRLKIEKLADRWQAEVILDV